MRLHPADIEQLARRVAELIGSTQPPPSGQLLDAAQLARVLGIERDCLRARLRAGQLASRGPAPSLARRSSPRPTRHARAKDGDDRA